MHKHNHVRRALGILAVSALLLSALVPVAMATHQTGTHVRTPFGPIDPGAGHTYEDDEEVAHWPGVASLDGLANKVVQLGDAVGDGSMFLDSQYNVGVNPYARTEFFTRTADVTIIPGQGTFLAFYGTWIDLDNNDRIDLWHDGLNHPEDEFKWRGIATEEQISMVIFTNPRFPTMGGLADSGQVRTTPGAWRDVDHPNATAAFQDRTGFGEAQQKWVIENGWPQGFLDEGFLMEFQTVVVANASTVTGGQRVDVRDPEAFVDVDKYQSLDPTVEMLYVTSARLVLSEMNKAIADAIATANFVINEYNTKVFPVVNDTRNDAMAVYDEHLGPTVDETLEPVFDIVDPIIDGGIDGALALVDTAFDASRLVHEIIYPKYAKEPNTDGDNYGGRALFGNVGDIPGTGNTYAGYQLDWGLWIDAWAEMQVGNPSNVDVRPANVAAGVYGYAPESADPWNPNGDREQRRGGGVQLSFRAVTALWKDINKDGWIGVWCDPEDPEDWDAENDRCATDPSDFYINDASPQRNGRAAPPGGFEGEVFGLCGVSTIKGGTITLTPVEGTWPVGTTVVTNYDKPTSEIWDQTWDTSKGGTSDPIVLNWDSQCTSSAQVVRAVDQVWFPLGNPDVTIRTDTTGSITGFKNPDDDTITLSQTVTDVDFYYPRM